MHFILSSSLIERMFYWYKDARVAAGLSKNHSDMIFFGLTDGQSLGKLAALRNPWSQK